MKVLVLHSCKIQDSSSNLVTTFKYEIDNNAKRYHIETENEPYISIDKVDGLTIRNCCSSNEWK